MSLVDDIRKLDPEPELLNTFEKRAAAACTKSVQWIITCMKEDIREKKYTVHSSGKQWSGTLPLICYRYDTEHPINNELWEIERDYECAYPVDHIFYKYGTNSEENAEYLASLVINALVQKGYKCKVDKKREEYSKGFFKVIKWGSIGYNIMLTFRW